MTTAIDLITRAAQEIGATQSGEALTAADGADGLVRLNSMLDGWALDRLLVYQIKQSSYSWPASTSSRTIGSGGNFSATRPNRIEAGTFFRDSNNNDYPVQLIDREAYDGIPLKTSVASVWPDYLFYDPEYPLGIIYVYPVPSAITTLYLNTWQILQSFAAMTTSLSLPPGYEDAIIYNLSLRLASMFGLKADDSLRALAKETKATIEGHNAPTLIAQTEIPHLSGGAGGANILTGP